MKDPLRLLATGFLLLLGGFFSLFFMVLRIVKPDFLLSFLAYTACSIGLILGLIGLVRWRR